MTSDTSSQIIIRSRLEKEEFIKANKVTIKMLYRKRKWFLTYAVILIIVIITAVALVNGQEHSSTVTQYVDSSTRDADTALWSHLSTIVKLVGIAAFVLALILSKRAPKRHYESNKLIQEEMIFIFDDMTLECKAERSFSKLNWNEVNKVCVSREFFVIFTSDRTVWIIPKRNVDSADAARLTELFKSKLQKKKLVTANF